jgi:hypothetical protein
VRDHPIHQMIKDECTLHHAEPGVMDEYGDRPIATVTTTDERCYWAQSTASEADEIERERWRVYFLPDTVIDANDFIEYRGNEFYVWGNPWTVNDPVTDHPTHIEAAVVRRI